MYLVFGSLVEPKYLERVTGHSSLVDETAQQLSAALITEPDQLLMHAEL
jgi:hypothetical protein